MDRPPLWADRRHAGRQLAERLRERGVNADTIVLGLPRGGVVVAAEVARALDLELDALVVCKVGVPWHPELAIGAVGGTGVRVRNDNVLLYAGLTDDQLTQAYAVAEKEVQRKENALRAGLPQPQLADRPVIIVDDGIATGATALAAAEIVRAQTTEQVILAVPVAPHDPDPRIDEVFDALVVLARPRRFGSVGTWYRDFRQVDDEELRVLLSG